MPGQFQLTFSKSAFCCSLFVLFFHQSLSPVTNSVFAKLSTFLWHLIPNAESFQERNTMCTGYFFTVLFTIVSEI